MAENYLVIVTALSTLAGSLGTLYITKHFDSKQKDKDHRNALQATWFTKKLDAAEVITAQHSLMLYSIFSISMTLKYIRLDSESLPENSRLDIGEHLQNEAQRGLDNASKIDTVLSNTLFLYFQVAKAKSSEIKNIAISFYDMADNIYPNFVLADGSPIGSEERSKYSATINEMHKLYDQLKSAIEDQIQIIGDSFKSYDL